MEVNAEASRPVKQKVPFRPDTNNRHWRSQLIADEADCFDQNIEPFFWDKATHSKNKTILRDG